MGKTDVEKAIHSAIQNNNEVLGSRFDKLDTTIAKVAGVLANLATKDDLSALVNKLDGHDKAIADIQESIKSMSAEIRECKAQLAATADDHNMGTDGPSRKSTRRSEYSASQSEVSFGTESGQSASTSASRTDPGSDPTKVFLAGFLKHLLRETVEQ